jgi:WD40 repeat protein
MITGVVATGRLKPCFLPVALLGLVSIALGGCFFQGGHDPFVQTGSMTVARTTQTATRLVDGRVLIAGGNGKATAEIYDPSKGAFSGTWSMETERDNAVAALLPDGRVLVAGGNDANGNPLSSAELYDPSTGAFSRTSSMEGPRADGATSVSLADGRVLVAGGSADYEFDYALASAETYDPKTGTFSPTGSMSQARINATATLLSDGRVLVTGGSDSDLNRLPSAELFDPRTGAFTATGSMRAARDQHGATRLLDGRVLIAGGCGGLNLSPSLASAELYDPATGQFNTTGSLGVAECEVAAVTLSSGEVLVLGTDAEIYDPSAGQFQATRRPGGLLGGGTATLLVDGRVLIAGGSTENDQPPFAYDTAYLYVP